MNDQARLDAAPDGWGRVTSHNFCPVCGKPDWCTFSLTTGAVCCMRNQSDHELRNGGWLHWPIANKRLENWPNDPRLDPLILPLEAPLATIQRRDAAYRTLLALLDLSPEHHLDLHQRRGLSEEAIERKAYRTLPRRGRAAFCRDIAQSVDLAGVPGFYRSRGGHSTYLTIAGFSGLLIPIRDTSGRIVAAQIRTDNLANSSVGGRKSGRYRWLSSVRRQGGASSGAPAHLALPQNLPPERLVTRGLWITEGPLKADIASERLRTTVLGLPGIASWRGSRAVEIAQELRPAFVTIAYDQDGSRLTRLHEAALAQALIDCGFRVRIARWENPSGQTKGIDDLLIAGGHYGAFELAPIPPRLG